MSSSVYRNTPVVDNRYLDILQWPMPELSTLNLRTITLEPKYNHRPDVLANDLYGNPKLWWVFATLNPDAIQDPILDMVSGMTINVIDEFR